MEPKTKAKGQQVTLRQTRSCIGRPGRQRRTLLALRLGKIGRSVKVSSNPAMEGMINKISHLVEISREEK